MSPRTAARTLAITAVTGLGLTALATPALASDTTTVTLEGLEGDLEFVPDEDPEEADRWTGGTFTPADSLQPPQVVGTSVTFVFEAGISLGESSAYLRTTEAGALFTADGSTDCAIPPEPPDGCWVVPSQSTTFLIGVGANNDRVMVFTTGGKPGYVVGNVPMDPSMAFTVTYSDSPTPSPGGSSTPTAPIYDLTFDPMETDATCSVAGVSAPRGTWVTVEAASGCVAPRTNPDATLLGWATDPDFSVEIAQRQIDNGWGAYETFDSDGELTGVFIPAGGTTLLTSPRNLHAIWSS